MKKVFFILWALAALPAPSFAQTRKEKKQLTQERDKYLFAVKPLNNGFSGMVPVEVIDNIFIVPVTIRGKVYRFIYDSGAITVISDSLQQELGLQPVLNRPVQDAAGTSRAISYYRIDSLQLGPALFGSIGAGAISTDRISKLACGRIDGLLGANVMRSCHWKIDYAGKQIYVSDQPFKPAANAIKLDFTENFSGTPEISMRLGGYRFRAMWDCGNNGLLDIPDSLFFKSTKAATAPRIKGAGINAQSLFHHAAVIQHRVLLDTLYFGDQLLQEEWINVVPGPDPLIGNQFMKRYRTVIPDWETHVIYLEAAPSPYDEAAYKSFGFAPGMENGQLKVVFLWENSPAAQQGLKLGDVITSINNQSTGTLGEEAWCLLRLALKAHRKELQLTTGTAGGERTYTLPWQQLIKP